MGSGAGLLRGGGAMSPIDFAGTTTVFGKDQPEYIPLPARVGPDGVVLTCWRLSWLDRLKLILGRPLWLEVLTFNQRLQPLRLSVETRYFDTRR